MGSSFKNYNVALFFSHDHSETYKGQLISKGTFGVFKSTTKPPNFFKWYVLKLISDYFYLTQGKNPQKNLVGFFADLKTP